MAADIARSLRHGPRAVMREHLARGPQEARALAFLMIGCLVVWVAQWPRLLREAGANVLMDPPGAAFDQLVGTALFGWVMVVPLLFYALAFVVHHLVRLVVGRGAPWSARLALFWSWLAASPLALLAGLGWALAGASALTDALALAWLGAFVAFWALSQWEAASGPRVHAL